MSMYGTHSVARRRARANDLQRRCHEEDRGGCRRASGSFHFTTPHHEPRAQPSQCTQAHCIYTARAAASSLAKSGVPRPVTCRETNASISQPRPITNGQHIGNTYRVPSLCGRKALRAAARVRARRDVVQRARAIHVQERVQEPERRLPRGSEMVVDQGDDAGEQRARRARARDEGKLSLEGDRVVDADRGHVRVRASALVKPARVDGAPCPCEVCGDGGLLVGGYREHVGEPARGEGGRRFVDDSRGGIYLRGADGG